MLYIARTHTHTIVPPRVRRVRERVVAEGIDRGDQRRIVRPRLPQRVHAVRVYTEQFRRLRIVQRRDRHLRGLQDAPVFARRHGRLDRQHGRPLRALRGVSEGVRQQQEFL